MLNQVACVVMAEWAFSSGMFYKMAQEMIGVVKNFHLANPEVISHVGDTDAKRLDDFIRRRCLVKFSAPFTPVVPCEGDLGGTCGR